MVQLKTQHLKCDLPVHVYSGGASSENSPGPENICQVLIGTKVKFEN